MLGRIVIWDDAVTDGAIAGVCAAFDFISRVCISAGVGGGTVDTGGADACIAACGTSSATGGREAEDFLASLTVAAGAEVLALNSGEFGSANLFAETEAGAETPETEASSVAASSAERAEIGRAHV